MRIVIHAVGRMKSGPETELCNRYLDRFSKSGTPLGLQFGGVVEPVESRAADAVSRKREEAGKLSAHLEGAALILLDERGEAQSSRDFAQMLARYRDDGQPSVVFAIGGPDGHEPALRQRADRVLSFGAATFPHQITRIVLAEQLYRAATILSGHPYHRD